MNKKRKLTLRRWHQWVGMIVSLFVILLVSTGIMLNHTQELKLGSRYIKSDWMLAWYGIRPVQRTVQYQLDRQYLVQIGEQVYLNRKRLIRIDKPLIGAVQTRQFIVAGFRDRIVLLNRQGEIVETINGHQGLPFPLKKVAWRKSDGLMLATTNGSFRFDLDQLKSRRLQQVNTDWVNRAELPAKLKTWVVADYQNYRLSWERVLLDLHSGRLFGSWGVYLIDLFAILLLFLGISGWVVWWRTRRLKFKVAAET